MKPSRRWFQYSLRSFLVLLTAVAVWLGWKVDRPRRRNVAIEAIESAGGSVVCDESGSPIIVMLRQPAVQAANRTLVMPPGYQTGFYEIGQPVTISDEEMKYVAQLEGLEAILISGIPITDSGLTRLHRLTRLRVINVHHTHASDAGIADLRNALPVCRINYLPLR